jgi:glutamate--cysteine ligase
MHPTGLTRKKIVEYFLEACRPRAEWLVGMEVEKLGRDGATGRPLPYEGPGPSVRRILETYHDLRGGDAVYEGDHLVGMAGTWGTLSLEPGGQVEWSSPPVPDLDKLGQDFHAHREALRETGARAGVRWLDVAMDPDHGVEEMSWMPKARYVIMSDYLGARGALAHRMMKQTASIQCAFDFESPEDWARKFRAAALLSPVSVALFANSSRVDGSESGWRSFRQRIWRDTDPDRCGLPAVVFDPGFSIEAWIDWVASVPAIFQVRARGLVGCGGVPFARLAERRGCTAPNLDDWELHLSTIFTEVRSYAYIEVRSADLQPDDRVLAVPAFWTGILYHPEGIAFALEAAAGHATHAAWNDAMERAARHGLDAEVEGVAMRDLAARALAASARGLRGGAACAGSGSDPAAPLVRLAAECGLDLPDGAA